MPRKGRRGEGGGGSGHAPPLRKSMGGGSEFYRILHRKISELLFIETAKNYRKPFFRYFIGLIIRKFILRLNITSDKILRHSIAAARSIFGKHSWIQYITKVNICVFHIFHHWYISNMKTLTTPVMSMEASWIYFLRD